MNDTPLVTVITPTFNRADFLAEAVESVLAQTYQNFELYVVDDGSTDNTRALMERYLEDPRARYLYQENQGQNVARNHALKKAQGDFIAFLDSDNAWLPDRLEKQLPYFDEQPDLGVVYGRNININEHGERITRGQMQRYSGWITGKLLRDNFVSFNTTLTRRECFRLHGGPSEKYRVADDYDLWLRISTTHKFLFVPEYFGYYRLMPDQISTDKIRRYVVNEKILEQFIQEHPDSLTPEEISTGWSYFYTRKGRYLASHGKLRDALACYHQALRHEPASSRTWRALAKLPYDRLSRSHAWNRR